MKRFLRISPLTVLLAGILIAGVSLAATAALRVNAIDMPDGTGTALSATGHGVLKYDNVSHAFQASTNGGAFASIGGGGASTGNWSFSGNNADLTAGAVMGLGLTTATGLSFGPTATHWEMGTANAGVTATFFTSNTTSAQVGSTGGDYMQMGGGTLTMVAGTTPRVTIGSSGLAPATDLAYKSSDLSHRWAEDWSVLYMTKLGTAIPSATTIAPVSAMVHITGTTPIATITVPTSSFVGCIDLIPDGAFTTTVAGNIALASTAVVNKDLRECFDGTKWYPSY